MGESDDDKNEDDEEGEIEDDGGSENEDDVKNENKDDDRDECDNDSKNESKDDDDEQVTTKLNMKVKIKVGGESKNVEKGCVQSHIDRDKKKVIENDENYDGSVGEGEVENQDESYDYKEGGR